MTAWTNTIRFEPAHNTDKWYTDKWYCTNCESEYDNPLDAVQCDEEDCST